MQGLTLREAQLAVAAGTNAMLLCGTSNAICQLQALSPVGRCRTLDAAADGCVVAHKAVMPNGTDLRALVQTCEMAPFRLSNLA